MPAGRLDSNSAALLALTQDGRTVRQLIGQDTLINKKYLVRLQYAKPGWPPDADLKKLGHDLWIDGKPLLNNGRPYFHWLSRASRAGRRRTQRNSLLLAEPDENRQLKSALHFDSFFLTKPCTM
jgi:16S rRNA U516 pseudouridylate synthase RsuA-like enzyme